MSELGVECGDVIGGNLYVEAQLGRGAMAEVYQVRDVTDGTRHALKILTSDDDRIRRRIFKEGELIASLDSPFIVALRGEMRVHGQPALLMERVRGPTLSQYLKADSNPPRKYAMALFRGICMGVGAAHAKGIVHRDLKPANVLLHVDGASVIPKVVDFGVAKDLVGGQGLTQSRSAWGTPRYMAPEQLNDSATVDRRADMWALGVILYRLLLGKLPFEANDRDLLLDIVLGRYTPPREIDAKLSEELVFAIEELLQPEVEKRLPDVPTLFGLLDGRTSLARNDALGTLPKLARKPHTRLPTAIPTQSLPESIQRVLADRDRFEADSDAPEASLAPPPVPPEYVGDSAMPRTMTPDSVDRMRPPEDAVRTASLVPLSMSDDETMDTESTVPPPADTGWNWIDYALGALVGAMGMGVVAIALVGMWLLSTL